MKLEILMWSNLKKYQSGQTIVEAIVALVIILLIITAIAVVIVNGLYNSSFVKNQNEANKYAQQGIETVRNLQQNNLTLFEGYASSLGAYCIDESTGMLYTVGCQGDSVNTGREYNRTVLFTPNDPKCENSNPLTRALKVTVNVKWSSSKCPDTNTFCHKSQLITCMPYKYPSSNP
jgi:type II secretory pathway pseudopilin PulG